MPGLPARSSVQRLPLPIRRRANFQRESPRRTRTGVVLSTAGEIRSAGAIGAAGMGATGLATGAGAAKISARASGADGPAIAIRDGICGSGRTSLGAAGREPTCAAGTTATKFGVNVGLIGEIAEPRAEGAVENGEISSGEAGWTEGLILRFA